MTGICSFGEEILSAEGAELRWRSMEDHFWLRSNGQESV